jgi:quercetin dioxygenase-like cupin family protein
MKTNLAGAALLALGAASLSGCIHVTVRDHGGSGEENAAITCASPASGATITSTPVASRAIPDAPGKTLTSVRLDVPPGANSNPHRHAGLVYVYVLEGRVCSQVTGDVGLKPYRAGESFFEPPGSQHLGFTNPWPTSAKVLVTFVANTGDVLTSPL